MSGRYRRIHPDIWLDKRFHTLDNNEALAWIALFGRCVDDYGRAQLEPVEFSLKVPRFKAEQWEKYIEKFASLGILTVYVVGKQKYVWLPNFERLQMVRSPTPSLCPPAPEGGSILPDKKLPPEEDIPYAAIVELWNQICGDWCPHVMVKRLGRERTATIKRIWKTGKKYQTLEWWKGYFEKVASSDFLTGRSGGTFRAPFQWCLIQKNMTKILEGNYINRNTPSTKGGGKMNKKNKDAVEDFLGEKP